MLIIALLCYAHEMRRTVVSLRQLPLRSVSMHLPDRRFALHALSSSCGHAKEVETTYNWNGLSRGKREFAVLQLTLAGTGELHYEGNLFALGPGDLMLVHIPHQHQYRLPPHSPSWEFVFVVVVGREILRVAKRVEAKSGPVVRIRDGSRVLDVFAAILRHAMAGDFSRVASMQFALSDLTYSLGMAILQEALPPGGDGDSSQWLDDVTSYCRENLSKRIAVSQLAGIASLSRSHFSREFTAKVGVSPQEFLVQQRMRHAIELLYSRGLTIKEIGYRCGYRDENYFCRAFRKAMGTSPGEYRKSGI